MDHFTVATTETSTPSTQNLRCAHEKDWRSSEMVSFSADHLNVPSPSNMTGSPEQPEDIKRLSFAAIFFLFLLKLRATFSRCF